MTSLLFTLPVFFNRRNDAAERYQKTRNTGWHKTQIREAKWVQTNSNWWVSAVFTPLIVSWIASMREIRPRKDWGHPAWWIFIESFLQLCFEGKWLQNRLRADEKWVEITVGGQYPGTPTWRFLHCPQWVLNERHLRRFSTQWEYWTSLFVGIYSFRKSSFFLSRKLFWLYLQLNL